MIGERLSNKLFPLSYRYKNGKVDGPVTGPWPGSSWHFNEALKNPRWEDYNVTYVRRNRFAYLGYGRTVQEEHGESIAEHLTEDFSDEVTEG